MGALTSAAFHYGLRTGIYTGDDIVGVACGKCGMAADYEVRGRSLTIFMECEHGHGAARVTVK